MAIPTVLVTFPADADRRTAIASALDDGVEVAYVEDLPESAVPDAVEAAAGLLSWVPTRELPEAAFDRLHAGQFVQTVSAGVDHLPLERFPDGVTLLSNAGAYAEPMAEHVLALYLALSKRLLVEHRKLEAGEFDQFRPNRRVAGSTVGIVGYGAIGQATARLLERLDVEVMAINRSGEADRPPAFLGTPDDLERVLRRVDGLVLSAPLTPETRGLVDAERLSMMADDAMLINVARGELIVQADLYEHLRTHPEFQAGLEAWWTEPVRHGEFSLDYPLLDLPNVIGCPHNSGQVPGIHEAGQARAARNLVAAVTGGEPVHVVDPELGY